MEKKDYETQSANYEDLAFKSAAQFFAEELFPLFGIPGEIERVAPTEAVHLEMKQMYQDFNFWMKGGYLVHIEFQSTWSWKKDLRRFREYEAVTSRTYGVNVKTYVVFSGNVKNPRTAMDVGSGIYEVTPIILQNKNADELIQKIKEKKQQGKLPNKKELVALLLTPLMSGETSRFERIRYGFEAIRDTQETSGEQDREKLVKMQAVLYAFANKFLEKRELERLKEATGMTVLGQMLVEDGIKIGEERGIKIGEQKGLKLGEQKGLKLGEQKGLKIGKQNGKLEVLLDILSDYGTPDEELLKKIQSESDSNTLSQWIKLAARAGSIQAFEEQIQ